MRHSSWGYGKHSDFIVQQCPVLISISATDSVSAAWKFITGQWMTSYSNSNSLTRQCARSPVSLATVSIHRSASSLVRVLKWDISKYGRQIVVAHITTRCFLTVACSIWILSFNLRYKYSTGLLFPSSGSQRCTNQFYLLQAPTWSVRAGLGF